MTANKKKKVTFSPFLRALLSTLAIAILSNCGPASRDLPPIDQQIFDQSKLLVDSLFNNFGIIPPVEEINLLIFKEEQRAEIWISPSRKPAKMFSIPHFNGNTTQGPLLYNSEDHLPEGIYGLQLENDDRPGFSLFIDFPGELDKVKARADGRVNSMRPFRIQSDQQSCKDCITLPELHLYKLINTVRSSIESKAIVFPNDPRPSVHFKPCYPCSEWYVELYEMLELELLKFPVEQ